MFLLQSPKDLAYGHGGQQGQRSLHCQDFRLRQDREARLPNPRRTWFVNFRNLKTKKKKKSFFFQDCPVRRMMQWIRIPSLSKSSTPSTRPSVPELTSTSSSNPCRIFDNKYYNYVEKMQRLIYSSILNGVLRHLSTRQTIL